MGKAVSSLAPVIGIGAALVAGPGGAPIGAAIGAGVGALFGSAGAGREQRKAGKLERKRIAAQSRLAEIQRVRERRKATAEATRARALTTAEAAATGTVGTSAVTGALSSISAQEAERLGFSGVTTGVGEAVAGFAAKESKARGRATEFEAIAGLPGQLGITPSFGSIFKSDESAE